MRRILYWIRRILVPFRPANIGRTVVTNPVIAGLFLFAIVALVVLAVSWHRYSNSDFMEGIIIEAHGMLLDVLVVGVFLAMLLRLGARKQEIQRQEEGIDDYRGWESDEASHRIAGCIRRLNRLGVTTMTLTDCWLSKAVLTEANLEGSRLIEANLDDAVLCRTVFRAAYLNNASLQRADLRGASFQDALAKRANFSGANLTRANLYGCDLRNSTFESANLEEAAFLDTNLSGASFRGATLHRLNQFGRPIGDSDLSNTDLRDTDWSEAFLCGLKLQGANLQGACFEKSEIFACDFRECEGLSIEQLRGVKSIYNTKFDSDLQDQLNREVPQLFRTE